MLATSSNMVPCGSAASSEGAKSRAACSGKCMNAACATAPSVWVLAVCSAMLVLFEKQTDGRLALLRMGEIGVASSFEQCGTYLNDAAKNLRFNQLLLVGSASDIAWVHALLPKAAAKCIVAEIHYPLMPGWFRPSPSMEPLQHALEPVLRA